eukprot:2060335-Amphidinium_carterae.1
MANLEVWLFRTDAVEYGLGQKRLMMLSMKYTRGCERGRFSKNPKNEVKANSKGFTVRGGNNGNPSPSPVRATMSPRGLAPQGSPVLVARPIDGRGTSPPRYFMPVPMREPVAPVSPVREGSFEDSQNTFALQLLRT